MERKLIVAVLKMRDAGWVIPRYQHAFPRRLQGVLTLQEEQVPSLNRSAYVATLRDPATGAPVDGLAPLIDARLIRALADEWIWTGMEHVLVGLRECDCAQTWQVRLVALESPDQIAFFALKGFNFMHDGSQLWP